MRDPWAETPKKIGQTTLSGEIRSADNETADAYPATLKTIIEEGYVDKQNYDTDKTGVYYKMLPDKTLYITLFHNATYT